MTDTITIKQGDITGNIDELTYCGAQGFQESNTWEVAEESLRGGADVQLQTGPAIIFCGDTEISVTLTILEYLDEEVDEEIEEDRNDEEVPVCEFEILPEDGQIDRLAALLGLLEN